MGWETRGRRRYYYNKRRAGRRVVSEYVPPGMAEVAAEVKAILQAQREAERLADQLEQAKLSRLALVGADMDGLVRALVALALIDAGFHHHKGQWRKRRHGKSK